MSENDPIDFSAIDPAKSERRWALMVSSVATRALERRRVLSVASQMVAWARPTLALAAALAVIVWTGVFFIPAKRAAEVSPGDLLSQWANGEESPSTAAILEVFGGDHGGR